VIVGTILDLAKKAGDLITDADRTYFNRRSKENKYSYDVPTTAGRINT